MKHSALHFLAVGFLLILLYLRFDAIMRVFFITFLAILLAIFLLGSGKVISNKIGGKPNIWGVAIFVLLIGVISLILGFSGEAIAEQADSLQQQLVPAISSVQASLEGYGWGQSLIQAINNFDVSQYVTRIGDVADAIGGALVATAVIIVVGIYLTIDPKTYKEGMIKYAPKNMQAIVKKLSSKLPKELYRWVIGRIASMVVVFVLTLIGLLILQVPLPLVLALLAGLLSFIPNIGPILSGVLAALVGLSISPLMALWVILLFVGVQILESNLITPLIEKKAVSMPPGLLLITQLLLGVTFGILGLIVATPLLVAARSILQETQ